MDPLLVLPLLVTLWCAGFLVQIVNAWRRSGFRARIGAWTAKLVLVLIGIWGGAALGSQAGVYVAFATWLVLLVAPTLAANGHARALQVLDYGRARRFAQGVRLVHPFDGWPGEPSLLALIVRTRSGDATAIGELRRQSDAGEGLEVSRRHAEGEIARITGDWDGVLTATRQPGDEMLRLRALGETGRLEELVAEHVRSPADPSCDLMLFVFAGRCLGVEALLGAAPFATLTARQREVWRATAALAVDPGDAEARARLEASAEGPQRAALITRRLDGTLAVSSTLSPDGRATVERREREVLADAAAGRLAAAPRIARMPVVTWGLIAANLAAFSAELWVGGWDGTTDVDVLYDLGALWPPAVLQDGEWSRPLTALFLHAGPLHLALNMLALLVFGRLVEARAGRLATAAFYMTAGVGSMGGVLLLGWAFDEPTILLVGASGAILGLLGVLAGFVLRDGWRGAPGAWRRLPSIAFIVGLQMIFDLLVPEVSSAAHACGFAVGLAAGLVLEKRTGSNR